MSTVLTKPVLLDETGQSIVDKLDEIKQAIGGSGEFTPVNIRVTTPPTKTTYFAGDTLDLSGMVVSLIGTNGGMYDVTGDCIFSPADGAILTGSDTEVSISYTWYKDSTVFTASQKLTLKELTSIVVTTPPTKTEYVDGDTLDLTGMVVTATFDDGTTEIVTNNCSYSPANGAILSTSDTEITISYTIGGITKTTAQSIFVESKVFPWATATDEQLIKMVQAYYNGDLTLADIQSVWSIGDTREMTIDAIAASGTYNNNSWTVGESHRSQIVEVEILDFDHDILSTPIGGITKALITVDLKNCLRDANVADNDGENNAENGFMHNPAMNDGGWSQCERRKWCNGGFYQAIPSDIRNIIKPVNKLTSSGNKSSTIITDSDYIFIPSEIEVFGVVTNSFAGEGSQYAWFANAAANKYKLPKWTSSYGTSRWWERSPASASRTTDCRVSESGSSGTEYITNLIGLAPAWCM